MNAEQLDIVKRFVPIRHDIEIYAGDDYKVPVVFYDLNNDPFDLPVTTWTAHIREETDRKVYASFNIDATDAANGKVILSLTKAQSADLPSGVWDLELTNPETGTKTWVYGDITVIRDVTHV